MFINKESRKKSSFLNDTAIKRYGGGGKALAIKKKELFWELFFNWLNKLRLPLSSRVGGLNGPTIKKKINFFAASLSYEGKDVRGERVSGKT